MRRLIVVVALALVGAGVAAWRLEPTAAVESLVGSGSSAARATAAVHERFGDDAVYVLVRGDLARLLMTADLNRVLGLEGCLAGNVPRGAAVPGGPRSPCAALAREKLVHVVYGPGTFVNSAVTELTDQLQDRTRERAAEADRARRAAERLARSRGRPAREAKRLGREAEQLVYARFAQELLALNARYGLNLTGAPTLNDPDFVYQLVFDPSRGARTPKARFAYVFPSADAGLISVRPRAGLSDAQRARVVALVRDAVRMPEWQLAGGGAYVVTGVPVLAGDLTDELTGATLRLLLVGVLAMALVLALAFRVRPRLLPLALALCAVAIVFGALAALDLPLTLAAIAALPILLGLAVDYAIQFQAAHAAAGGAARRTAPGRSAAVRAIVTAAAATAAGFLVLLLSPIPLVRGFGLLLVAGVAIALAVTLVAAPAALALRPGPFARSFRGAAELVDAASATVARAAAAPFHRHSRHAAPRPPASAPSARSAAGALGAAARALAARRRWVLVVAAALAVCGWALEPRIGVVSDLPSLVPQRLAAVQDLDALQRATGTAGEVDVLVEADDLTDPKVVTWMRDYQLQVLTRQGYNAQDGCANARLCPALSLPDLLRAGNPTREQISALLDQLPPYFSKAAITPDRRTAVLAFGIRLQSLEDQRVVIEDLRARLDPPDGVRATVAGLPVQAADAQHALADPLRRILTSLAGLLAVALALLAATRSWRATWVPLAPIALATGWSALTLWLLGIPLNPLSAALGALVIAISTEFSVLLSARYRAERAAGRTAAEALTITYSQTGAAVLASGLTALAGFAVLIASDIALLRDFGLVTVIDLAVSLLGVLAVLPATLASGYARRT